STQRQAKLDRVALNVTNEEWIGLVDRFRANPTLSAELLGADVSEDTFSIRMVDLMNKRRKAIAEIKAKAKREKPMTPAQQKEFMQSSKSKKLKRSHSTEQPAELQETTSISAGVTIAAGDPIPAVTFVSAASFVLAGTPIAAGVSTTAGASGSASEVTVPIIELLDSPPKETSIPLDPETEEHDVPLRKSSRKKSIARRRTLPSRADLMVLYGMVSDKYKIKRASSIGLGLWSGLRTLITAREDRDASIIWDDQDQWEIRSWRFYALP
nr:hypothetical protein [Tanacetum cinerariifolium]